MDMIITRIYMLEFEHNLISINDRVPLENVVVAYETVSMHHHLEKQLISNQKKYNFCQKFLRKKILSSPTNSKYYIILKSLN